LQRVTPLVPIAIGITSVTANIFRHGWLLGVSIT
jgi:hypothetical protein